MHLTKKPVAFLTVMALLAGFCVPVSAAASYDVSVSGTTISFNEGGKAVKTATAKNTAILLGTAKNKDFVVQYNNTAGSASAVSLGAQKDLTISGTISSLTISSGLASDISLNIAKDAKIGQLIVYGSNDITLDGAVTALTMNGGSLDVTANGSVAKGRLTSVNASVNAIGEVAALEVKTGATVTGAGVKAQYKLVNSKVLGVNDKVGTGSTTLKTTTTTKTPVKTPVKKPATSNNSSATGTVKLTIPVLDMDSGDKLDEYTDLLSELVKGKDTKTGAVVYGTCEWITNQTMNSTKFVRFRFTPDDSSYKAVVDQIKVRVDDDNYTESKENPSSDRTIRLEGDGSTIKLQVAEKDGATLGDAYSQLESKIKAYSRSEDAELDGVLTWKSSSSTKIVDGKSYSFTFDPDDSDYKDVTGKVKIYYSR